MAVGEKNLEERIAKLEQHITALNAMNTNLIVRAEQAELKIEGLEVVIEAIMSQLPQDC